MKRNILLFLIIFVSVEVLIYITIKVNETNKVNQYLINKTNDVLIEYKTIYNFSEKIAYIVYKNNIETPKILSLLSKNLQPKDSLNHNRELLKKELSTLYKTLKLQNIKQLHFHLPNGDSFLRFHQVDKYGDNLLKTRETVKYVVENKKHIDGFEMGKAFHGFRFVYPLFLNNIYVGSVELSFSSTHILNSFKTNFKLLGNIFIKKEIIDKKVWSNFKSNYIQAPMDGFYIDKSLKTKFKNDKTKRYIMNSTDDFKESLLNKVKLEKDFSMYNKEQSILYSGIILKHPIHNAFLGFLIIPQEDKFLDSMYKSFLHQFIAITIIFLLFLYIIYSRLTLKEVLLKEIKSHTKELIITQKQKEEQLQIIAEQAKSAAIGELLNMIAHQWRQPLTKINSQTALIFKDCYTSNIDKDRLKETVANIEEITLYLSKTISDFSNFNKQNNKYELKDYVLKDLIQNCIDILLPMNKVIYCIDVVVVDNIKIRAIESQIQQIILAIINNSIDIFKQRDILYPTLKITLYQENEFSCVEFTDNGGGIEESYIDKIFDLHFSTKNEETSSRGFGLYIVKQILNQKLNGTIEVKNINNGVSFLIKYKDI